MYVYMYVCLVNRKGGLVGQGKGRNEVQLLQEIQLHKEGKVKRSDALKVKVSRVFLFNYIELLPSAMGEVVEVEKG